MKTDLKREVCSVLFKIIACCFSFSTKYPMVRRWALYQDYCMIFFWIWKICLANCFIKKTLLRIWLMTDSITLMENTFPKQFSTAGNNFCWRTSTSTSEFIVLSTVSIQNTCSILVSKLTKHPHVAILAIKFNAWFQALLLEFRRKEYER